jgi:azurin
VHLLRALPFVPADDRMRPLRQQLAAPLTALLNETKDPAQRAAALSALAATRADAATFALLAREITAPPAGADATTKTAAIAALLTLPASARASNDLEPLARALIAIVRETPTNQRTQPRILQVVQLGEELATALPEPVRVSVRRELRALSVRVVRVETRPEQMLFDLNWFVVEAGKPVQVSLTNPDAMPHNLIIAKPGTLNEVATAATTMTMPTDPAVKPFVPDLPAVLQATRLLNEGETAQLSFPAPAQPGEYVFLCTFPGHWVRMYGVMLVVDNLEAWEAKPTTPVDPVTKQPYASQKK